MKLLKLVILTVLVALTFSFNKKESNEDNYKERITIREKKVRIYFLPGIDASQKRQGREWTELNYHIYLGQMTEQTDNYETWTYSVKPGTTSVGNHSDQDDGELPYPEAPGGEYVSVQFNFDPNGPSFTYN